MDAADRRAIPEDAVLRQSEDGRGVRHQPLAGAASDATDDYVVPPLPAGSRSDQLPRHASNALAAWERKRETAD